jgi:DHA2 family multidrug resistance protein
LGPTLGGWITDNYSWRWIFYINVPVGILAVLLVSQLIQDPPYLSSRKKSAAKFDYIGFALLAIGVGALQVALDKGQEDDWFGSRFITTLIVIAIVGLISMVIWEWFRKEPVVDVHLFRMFNFASCSVMMFVLGIVLFSSTVLLPQFLQTLMGYTAQSAGMVLSAAAILLAFLLPVVGRLAARFQARHLLAFGWITLGMAMYLTCKRIDLLISFRAATWLRVWQYLPVGFLFVPLTMAAYVGLPEEKSNAAAGLINFVRNIGQSVGTSAVTTLIARRSQYHQSVLSAYTRSFRFDAAVAALTTRLTHVGLSMHSAHEQALARMYGMVMQQAQALSYVDVYWLLAAISGLMFLLCFRLEKNEPGAASGEVAIG